LILSQRNLDEEANRSHHPLSSKKQLYDARIKTAEDNIHKILLHDDSSFKSLKEGMTKLMETI